MKPKVVWVIIILLIVAVGCEAQTTVSGTITDAGGQAWFGGTFNFQTISYPAPQNVNGILDGSGHYSVSITSPVGTYWNAEFCPLATAVCFTTGQFTIQGATQTISPTPPAILISLINPNPAIMRAYSDSEIASAIIGSLYYNIGSAIYHGCTAVTGQVCTTWANVGAGGSSTFPTLPGGTNTSSAFVCGTGCSITASGSGTITATNSGGINPPAGDIGGSAGTPTVIATHLAAALPINQGGTGTTTPGLIAGSNITITGSWPNQTVNSSGGGGGGVSSFSGDGVFITNSASTGAVTVTIGTAGAHRWWGNPTGSTAAPGYNLLTAADIPTLNQNTTGNAATATLATNASNLNGCVPSTAGDLCYWTGSAWSRVAGNASGTNFLSETSAGVPSWASPASGNTTSTSLTTNVVTKANGANSIINSSITDNGTTVTTTDTGGFVGPSFTANGATAGFFQCSAGTANGHATASTITTECPTAVTAYEVQLPTAIGTANQVLQISSAISGVAATTWATVTGNTTSTSLNTNVMPKANGANSIINSSVTDNGTVVTTTDTGGMAAPSFSTTGTTAGFLQLVNGSTNTPAANSFLFQAPATISTAYSVTVPPGAASGVLTNSNVANVITQGFSGDANHSATVTIGSGTSISATSLCSTGTCPAGTYRVNVYVDVTTACTTTGSYIVWLGYTDDAGAKAGSSTTTFVALNGNGVVQATGALALSSTANYGQGTFILRSTGATAINYGTTATACATGGPAVGKMYLSVEPVQ